MTEVIQDGVWVSIEYIRGTSTSSMRGLILEHDLNRIIQGTFTHKFVELTHAHWTQTVTLNNGKTGIKFYSYGKDGQWKWNTGQFFVEISKLISIAILEDMESFINKDYDFIYESNI